MSANRNIIRLDRSLPTWSWLAAVALLLLAFVGCRSHAPTAHLNPVDPSVALPTAETLEYPGPQRFWNTEGLVISPARIVAKVGSEVPMFAGICNGQGQLLPHEQVEWMLDNGGVGSFVSVNDPIRPFCLELVSTKARKVDNMYALTETSPANVILTRGTAGINDDMVMPRGYTWVTVTSPVEGSSYVTAFGPDVYSWDVRQKSARIIWIDADWHFPEAACAQMGCPVTLTTCVERHTTKAPVSDWIVKYTITGGVAAGFGAENAQSVEVATGEDGRACVEVIPAADANGTTCISVELIRSECATPGSPERLSIATAATQVTWGTPDPPAPPPSVPATPAAPAVPPATPPPAATPPVTPPPVATTPPAPALPQIELAVRGPETADLGSDITFDIDVINKGTAMATGLVLSARFDEGLKHSSGVNAITQRDFGDVQAGATRTIPLKFRVFKPGKQCFTIDLTDLANLSSNTPLFTKQHCITVPDRPQPPPEAALNINITGPESAVVGQEVRFNVKVDNVGDLAAGQVKINIEVDPSFQITGVDSDSGLTRTMTGGLEWKLDTLQPRGSVTHQIGCRCVAPATKGCCTGTVTIASREPRAHQHCVAIQPAPEAAQGTLKVQVAGNANPVRVNGNVAYRVTITNIGRVDEPQVRLTLTLPAEMSPVGQPRFNVPEESRDGRTIQFKPILVLRPNESITCDLVLRADRPGQASLRADVTSLNVAAPLSGTATTTISQ